MAVPERVAVVGAGAVGLTAAFDLARRGVAVTLYDRGDPGGGSTGRAAGICYDAYAEDVDVAVADRAMRRLRALDGEGDFAFHEAPYVFLAREGDAAAAGALREAAERMRVHGRSVSLRDGDALADLPVRTDDVAVAGVCENAGWADPGAYVDLFVEKCAAAGVAFRFGAPASLRLDPPGVLAGGEQTEFDAVVVAAGVWSGRLLADAGRSLPLEPYRAQAALLDCDYDGPTVYDATEESYFRPAPGGVLAGDGTEEGADPTDWDPTADDRFVAEAAASVARRTGTDPTPVRAWAGLCGATPDRYPLVGPVAPDVFVAAGWHGHGFMWAPATGERLADAVLGEGTLPAPFDPRRFGTGETP